MPRGHEVYREQDAARGPAEPPLGLKRAVAGRIRPPPDHLEPDRQQAQAEEVGHDVPGVEREAQYAEQSRRDPAKGEPADQQAQPCMPEPRDLRAHRDDPKALDIVDVLAAGREEETADRQR